MRSLKEEGGWKIWRMRIYPMLKTPVGTSWTQCTEFSGPMNLDEFPKTDLPCLVHEPPQRLPGGSAGAPSRMRLTRI